MKRFPSCRGQASVEYIVVLAFAVIVLLKPFSYADVADPGAATGEAPALQQVAKAVKDYHKHYTYAMAISTIPDCDYQFAYDKSSSPGDIAARIGLVASVSGSVDRCFDWANPDIQVSGLIGSIDVPATRDAVKAKIKEIAEDMIDGFIDDFANPGGLLTDMISFDITSFF